MPVVVAYPAFKNKNSNPFQSLLYAEMQALGWEVYDLDSAWSQLRRADILHLHWPDGFVFHPSLVKSTGRFILLVGILKLYRLMGARVIWTVHNLQSHENYHPRLERLVWRSFYRNIDALVVLNRFTQDKVKAKKILRQLPCKVICHGLYQKAGVDKKAVNRNCNEKTLMFFGKLRGYKKIPRLIEVFEELNDPRLSLVIAGACDSQQVGKYLMKKRALDGLTIIDRFIPDEELSSLLNRADYVIIPYHETLNSGVVFLALAHHKTVLAPKTEVISEIQNDFGADRIRLYEPPLNAQRLREMLELNTSFNQGETKPEKLEVVPEKYTWSMIAAQHDDFFKVLL